MFIHEIPRGFTLEDFESEIKYMTRKMYESEATAQGLRDGVCQLKQIMIDHVLDEKKIKPGDKCVVHFSNGDKHIVYEMAKHGTIWVKHFTKAGLICKGKMYYDYNYVELLEKI